MFNKMSRICLISEKLERLERKIHVEFAMHMKKKTIYRNFLSFVQDDRIPNFEIPIHCLNTF